MSGINCQLIVCILVTINESKKRIDNYLVKQTGYT